MNHKGQTLILFVILLPILLLIAALIIDLGLAGVEKTKISGVTNEILKTLYEERLSETLEEKIKEQYLKNKITITNIKAKGTEETLEIKVETKKESIFGKIIGIKDYSISTHKKIMKEQNDFKIWKE